MGDSENLIADPDDFDALWCQGAGQPAMDAKGWMARERWERERIETGITAAEWLEANLWPPMFVGDLWPASPDEYWRWDGQQWVESSCGVGGPRPVAPRRLSAWPCSPDGRWEWDGQHWVGRHPDSDEDRHLLPRPAGSIRVPDRRPPAADPGELRFSGAISGSSVPSPVACESYPPTPRPAGSFCSYTITAQGYDDGRAYFLKLSVYPYDGPACYELQPVLPAPYRPVPGQLYVKPPPDYPGFLNFVPKWEPGHAWFNAPDDLPTLAVAADERSGWFTARFVAHNPRAGQRPRLVVSGRFQCGDPSERD